MAARPQFNSKSPTIKRILREASELTLSPSPDYTASPASDADLFEWHFTLRGPPSSPFSDGIYHGRIVLPPTYPLRPPSFRFLTPSGRFETNREICLSISGHHEETWQPAWGIRTALVALRSFMETDAKGQLGGLECNEQIRKSIAADSVSWKCPSCGKTNQEILQECAEASAEKESEGSKREEEVVPKELKMGWKDEMGKEGGSEPKDEDTSAELAEGFVSTAPVVDDAPSMSAPGSAYPPARPGQTVSQPTGAAQASTSAMENMNGRGSNLASTQRARVGDVQSEHQRLAQSLRNSNNGVPIWVDRTIAGLVVCLVCMILKVLLGF